ncbi:MAG: hypothetical protein B7Z74_09670, partial [Deltaproteobacteria bacterium 21-66-5]
KLIDRAKALGMNALALTDHGNLHGALQFYQKAKAAGINPIIGYEAYIAPADRRQKEAAGMKEASFHLTLLAQNRVGFQNLVKLASADSFAIGELNRCAGTQFDPEVVRVFLETPIGREIRT